MSARDLQHCIERLSCGLLEVRLRYVLDLAVSPRLSHHCSFLSNLDLFLKLFDITSTKSFWGVRISSETPLL